MQWWHAKHSFCSPYMSHTALVFAFTFGDGSAVLQAFHAKKKAEEAAMKDMKAKAAQKGGFTKAGGKK